jgi:hypothetical protein
VAIIDLRLNIIFLLVFPRGRGQRLDLDATAFREDRENDEKLQHVQEYRVPGRASAPMHVPNNPLFGDARDSWTRTFRSLIPAHRPYKKRERH